MPTKKKRVISRLTQITVSNGGKIVTKQMNSNVKVREMASQIFVEPFIIFFKQCSENLQHFQLLFYDDKKQDKCQKCNTIFKSLKYYRLEKKKRKKTGVYKT